MTIEMDTALNQWYHTIAAWRAAKRANASQFEIIGRMEEMLAAEHVYYFVSREN